MLESSESSDELTYSEVIAQHQKVIMDHINALLNNHNDWEEQTNFTGTPPDLLEVDNSFSGSKGFMGAKSFFGNNGNMSSEEYEQFLADLWVGIILTLMVLSCVCCMCSCLLYHKFQQWKRTVLESRTANPNNPEAGNPDNESLPSYTIASGLPSYEEALEQLKVIKTSSPMSPKEQESVHQGPPPQWTPTSPITRLSVVDLFQLYKNTTDFPKT